MEIQALHNFHNEEYSREWAEKFIPSAPRIKLFETILRQIENAGYTKASVLELGIGPGFLAAYVLDRLPDIRYTGLDYSAAMLEIAGKRTAAHNERIDFIQADLIKEAWGKKIERTPDVIVTTWALHDLFEKKNIFNVYKSCFELLPDRGLLLNGDFIKPEESAHEYEGGRIKPSEHLDILRKAGFRDAICLEEFEKSVENPTTANNYACFRARK